MQVKNREKNVSEVTRKCQCRDDSVLHIDKVIPCLARLLWLAKASSVSSCDETSTS